MPSFAAVCGGKQFVSWNDVKRAVPFCYRYIAPGVLMQKGIVDELPSVFTDWQFVSYATSLEIKHEEIWVYLEGSKCKGEMRENGMACDVLVL